MTVVATPAVLPALGRVACTACYAGPVRFDATQQEGDGWRITANPLAWGSQRPKVLVMGFSKGPTQAGALARASHDQIAFRGAQGQAYKILAHLGLVPKVEDPKRAMIRLLGDSLGPFAFGSFIRCTVTRWDAKEEEWLGTGGGMLDRFVATPFGARVACSCAARFLATLPPETKLVVMYGLGSRLGYVEASERIIRQVRAGDGWRRHNDVSYGDAAVTFVHTERFRAQGALLPNWLGALDSTGKPRDPERVRLANLAATATRLALAA